ALRSLSGCGEPALPAYRKLLADASVSRHHAEVVESLGRASGRKIGEELEGILGRELAFWKKRGPTLPGGWWNGGGLQWGDVESLRDRYGVPLAAVRGLGKIHSPEGRKAVKQLRDFWLSLPQLKEIGQMGEECDRVLAEPRPRPPRAGEGK